MYNEEFKKIKGMWEINLAFITEGNLLENAANITLTD